MKVLKYTTELYKYYHVNHFVSFMEFEPTKVLQVLSKKTCLQIFEVIADQRNVHSQTLRSLNDYTEKQYHTATEKLMKYGMIKRRHSVFSLTSFGTIINQNKSKIDAAIREYSTLQAIDSVKGSKQERDRVMKILINDAIKNSDIKRILSRDNS